MTNPPYYAITKNARHARPTLVEGPNEKGVTIYQFNVLDRNYRLWMRGEVCIDAKSEYKRDRAAWVRIPPDGGIATQLRRALREYLHGQTEDARAINSASSKQGDENQ